MKCLLIPIKDGYILKEQTRDPIVEGSLYDTAVVRSEKANMGRNETGQNLETEDIPVLSCCFPADMPPCLGNAVDKNVSSIDEKERWEGKWAMQEVVES
jgi:hypothetical protein